MLKIYKKLMGTSGSIIALFLILTISSSQASLQSASMIENPGTFVASINPSTFEIGMPIYDAICLEFTVINAYPMYNAGDRMNYTLIDVQPDEYIFDEVIYNPNGTILNEGNYSVSRSELRLPLFMLTVNRTLIQEVFGTTTDWNISYIDNSQIFQQKAYDYPESNYTLYSEYVYDGITGWLMSLYQKRTAANQTIVMEVRLNAVEVATSTTTEIPTEPSSSENTTTTSSTTTIPGLSSFPGALEVAAISSILLIIYRRKR